MAFNSPLDELGIINRALAATGDNLVNAADDGSDEWNTCDPAYQAGISYASESHGWGFAALVVTLQPSPTPPQDTQWDTAYPIPSDCVHIIWLKINQDNSDPTSSTTAQMTLYDIMGTPTGPVIVTNAQGGPPPPIPPLVPSAITLKYISNSGALCDSTNGTPTLILALQSFVMSGIYRGLHEDTAEADKMWMAGEAMLQKALFQFAHCGFTFSQAPVAADWHWRLGRQRRPARLGLADGNSKDHRRTAGFFGRRTRRVAQARRRKSDHENRRSTGG
jgi:hypothetical protein